MADDSSSRDQNPTIAVEPAVDMAAEIVVADAPAATNSAVGTPGPATGTITPALSELPPEQIENSLKVSLADLCAKGAALFAHKNYEEAAEVYSQATEMQAEMNGEMSPDNAEIMFLYGRSLFKIGQSKSDVLGGKAPEEKKGGDKKSKLNRKAKGAKAESSAAGARAEDADPSEAQRITEEGVAIVAAETSAGKEEAATIDAKKPLFQFTGDENWDDSDGEEGAEAAEEGEEEGEDDLEVAFAILDFARVLFMKRLEQGNAETDEGKEKLEGDSLEMKHIKERLADTHDLLAEISLENERYPNAIMDSRASLKYKKELYPEESEIIAEAHFKLSLALEYASVTTTEEDKQSGPQQVDQDLRDEAATELEAAIASTKLKLQNKEVELATTHSPEDNDVTRAQIAEVKEVIADMEQRLVELRKPPIDMNAALNGPVGNAMGGILGAALGESPAQTEARIEEAKKTATDLTGLVRKKAKDEAQAAAEEGNQAKTNGSMTANSNGKRRAEEPAGGEDESKKARVEEVAEV